MRRGAGPTRASPSSPLRYSPLTPLLRSQIRFLRLLRFLPRGIVPPPFLEELHVSLSYPPLAMDRSRVRHPRGVAVRRRSRTDGPERVGRSRAGHAELRPRRAVDLGEGLEAGVRHQRHAPLAAGGRSVL